MRIIHIFETELNPMGGMGRVSYHWRSAFLDRGIEFVSIDVANVPRPRHKSLFDLSARACVKRIIRPGDVILVHEPLSGSFLNLGVKVIVFSHGVERRLAGLPSNDFSEPFRFKSALTWPLWWRRRHVADRGMRDSDFALVLCRDDYNYSITHYKRSEHATFCYRNGVDALATQDCVLNKNDPVTILFIGGWIPRKGIELLKTAYLHFRGKFPRVNWRFAGTNHSDRAVREFLGAVGDVSVEVLPRFLAQDEIALYRGAHLFVLPSFFEGLPLSLLQAMQQGLCCISTNICGQKDIIDSGVNGLLFDVGDKDGFINILERAINSPVLINSCGQFARKSVAGRDWPLVSAEVVDQIVRFTSK